MIWLLHSKVVMLFQWFEIKFYQSRRRAAGGSKRAGAGDRGGDTAESEHGGGGGGGGSGGGQLYSTPILVSYYLFLTDNTYITVCY